MIARVLKLFAYAKAPVKAFATFHPLRFLKYAAFLWVGKKIWNLVSGPERRRAVRSANPGGAGGGPSIRQGGAGTGGPSA